MNELENADIYEFYRKRRSVRKFSSEPVDRSLIENAVLAAGTAPSGANKQPWFFAIIESADMKRKLRAACEKVEADFYDKYASKQWLADLEALNTNPVKAFIEQAPYLIAVFSKSYDLVEGGRQNNYYPIESTGLAVGLLLSALHFAGLGTLTYTPKPMFFLRDILGLSKNHNPYMIVATGKPAADYCFPDITRKPLNEISQIF